MRDPSRASTPSLRRGAARPAFHPIAALAIAWIAFGAALLAAPPDEPPPPVPGASNTPELEIELVGEAIRGRLAAGADLERRILALEGREIALRDVLRIRFRRPAVAARWQLSIRIADGSRIHGNLIAAADRDHLRIQVPALAAPLDLPLEWVREIRRGAEVAEVADEVTADRVETSREAAISGVIGAITPEGVEIEDAALGKLTVPWDQVERVRVAPLDPPPALAEGAVPALVATDDGSRFRGSLLALDPARLEIESPLLGSLAVPELHRVSLELLLDRVAYLSDREPRRVEEGLPFSDYFPWKWQRDRNVLGGALRIGRETYRKGIGVHAQSSLTFGIEPGDLVFRAEVGIDVIGRPVEDNPQAGSVRFVVLVDGEEAWRSADVDWSSPPLPVEVPLAGRSELTLLVEMGLGLHVLDRADWGDARILRE